MEQRWPLVGRAGEVASLRASIAAGGALVAGVSGVGKTRLVREAMGSVDPDATLWIRATRAAAQINLGAFAQILPPEIHLDNDLADARLLSLAASSLIDNIADGERLTLIVDDAHALDEFSSTLLLHLAMSGRARLVMTMRSDEPAPEAVTVLWRDEYIARHDLAPLQPSDVHDLLAAVLPGGVDGLTSTALVEACDGNLLYLREMVRGLLDSAMLSQVRGRWFLFGPLSVPPRLTELISQRLEVLTSAERVALDALALGEPLSVETIEQRGELHLLESLERHDFVEVVDDGRRRQVVATHPMYAEVARATMPDSRRRLILAALADGIESTGRRRRGDSRRLAAWRMEAGGRIDPEMLMDAARDAIRMADHSTAERFARAALEQYRTAFADDSPVGADGSGDLADRYADAALVLGRALDGGGRFVDAEEQFRAAADAVHDDHLATQIALCRSDNMFRGLGDRHAAEVLLDEAESATASEEHLDELRAQRAHFALFAGEIDATLELTAPLLDRPGTAAYCEGALQASVASSMAGSTDLAISIARSAFETRVHLADTVQIAGPGIHLVALALAQFDAGRLVDASGTARAAYDAAVERRDRHGQAWLATVLSRIHLMTGAVATSARLSRESAVVFGELNHPGERWGLGGLALASAYLGDAAGASLAIEDLDAHGPTPVALMDVELDRCRAWAAVTGGQLQSASWILIETAERARLLGQVSLEAAVLHDVARFGSAPAVRVRLDDLAEAADGHLIAARARHVAALADQDAAALDAAAEHFGSLGMNLFAAEAATAAATAHHRDGAGRASAASLARREELLGHCEGAATPALLVGTLAAAELTRREREVATLAAAGKSNREIAGALVVSVRTVENHLQRAYEKLGVGGRDELEAALRS